MKPHQLFFYSLLVFLPSQFGLHFWPAWSFVLGRRVDYLSPTLYFTDILILLIFAAWFWENKLNFKFNLKKIINTTLFFLFVLINIYYSVNKPEAFYQWLKLTEFGLLGFYIFKNKPDTTKVILFMSFGVFYASTIAVIQFLLQHSLGGIFRFLGERTFNINTPGISRAEVCDPIRLSCTLALRAYGTFSHPNVLGGFLAVTLPLIIYKLGKKKQIWYLSTLIIGLFALVLTFSRSAMFVGATGIVLVLWQKKKIRKILLSVVFVLGIIFILQLKNLSLTDESIAVRGGLNVASLNLWQTSPLFGIGLGNFLVRLPQVLPLKTIYFLQPVHNIYLLLLSETGIAGLVIFLWLILKSLTGATSDKRQVTSKTDNHVNIRFTYHLSLITILLLGLVDHYPLDLQQGQLLFTLLIALSLDI